ncbi:hypothetical protein AALB39_00740 [Lachnospiraceae bacterium 54-53]
MPKSKKPSDTNTPKEQHKSRNTKAFSKRNIRTKIPKINIKIEIPILKNKRFFLLLTAILLIAVTGTVSALRLILPQKDTGAEKSTFVPARYFSEEEGISSVTAVVGDREFQSLTADTGEEAESLEEIYEYLHIKDVSSDLKIYRDYLEEEKDFIDVTGKRQPSSQSQTEGSEADSPGIYRLAGPSKDPGSFLSITLKQDSDSYTVTAVRENQPWNAYFKELWTQQKKELESSEKNPAPVTTLEQAENTVRAQGRERLGLPEAAESYEYIAAPGLSNIEEKNYYSVRTYKRQPDETLIYVATYLFDHNSGDVAFRYDEVTRDTTPLD